MGRVRTRSLMPSIVGLIACVSLCFPSLSSLAADGWISAFDTDARRCRSTCMHHFASFSDTEGSVDITITVRVRAFGSRKTFNAAWVKEWGTKLTGWNPSFLDGFCVNSEVPELWMLVKEDGTGALELPAYILGHEMIHALKLRLPQIRNPDQNETGTIWESGQARP